MKPQSQSSDHRAGAPDQARARADISTPLLELVRLLARQAARETFAALAIAESGTRSIRPLVRTPDNTEENSGDGDDQ